MAEVFTYSIYNPSAKCKYLWHMYRYLAHGTATDYMYDVARVPMAFTFEVCES